MDKFASLHAFTQVVQAQGFAAAAREMGVSRSAVNKLVLALEADLGVQLLHRSTRRVTPTETGLAFYDRCLTLLADLQEAELAVAQLQQEPKGTLRMNAPMTFGTMHLAGAIAQFMREYPAIHVQLVLEDRPIDPLTEGFDLTIRIGPPPESASLVVQQIGAMALVLCAAPAYLETQGIPQTPEDLKSHACLHYGHWATRFEWNLRDRNGIIRAIALSGPLCSNNGEVLREAAVQGLGIALLPRFIIDSALQRGDLRLLLQKFQPEPLPISVIYPVNRHLSVKVRLMIAFLKDLAALACRE
jgi:DNA-binding transcriptional LysR family regulator